MVNSVQRIVNQVSISGADVMLTLSTPVTSGDVITVAYAMPPSSALRSVTWCFVLGFTAKPVINNVESQCPVLISAVVDFTTPGILKMTFSSELLGTIVPEGTAFRVIINAVQRAVNKVSISGRDVMLTMATSVAYQDVITVSYTMPPSSALRSVDWCFILGFGPQHVDNKCLPDAKSKISSEISIIDDNVNYETNVSVELHTGFNDKDSRKPLIVSDDLIIYPNPASEFVNISFTEATDEARILRIFDLSGKLCLEYKIYPGVQQSEIQINLRAGLYILKIIQGVSTILTKQLVVL